MATEIAIHRQERCGNREGRHAEYHQDADTQRRPGEQRDAEEAHARRTFFVDGDSEVYAGHGRGDG